MNEYLAIPNPRNALEELRYLIIPPDLPDDSVVELVIKISNKNISIRDLSAFLEFIDHIHGRLTPEGLRSYARREYGHLEISRIKEGSWELILETTLSYLKQSEILLIIWLAIKYLPQAAQTFASAYNDYEQGRLARVNRKRIRMQMEGDEKLMSLDPKRRRDLITLIDILYTKEAGKLTRVNRFARKGLMDINISVRKNVVKKTDEDDS